MIIPIIPILVAILLLALALWIIKRVNIPQDIKNGLTIVAVVIFVLYLIALLSGYGGWISVRVG